MFQVEISPLKVEFLNIQINHTTLATFHLEPNKVPCYHPNAGKVGFMPMPYPVYLMPKKKCCVPPTRDEVNEF